MGYLKGGLKPPLAYIYTRKLVIPLLAPPFLTITNYGSDIELTWTDHPTHEYFEVHRSDTPYFTPVSGTLLASLPAGTTAYTDTNAAGAVNINHFYIVRAMRSGGSQTADSNEVGEIDYALNNAAGAYSLMTLPFSSTTLVDAASPADYTGNASALLKWNPDTQTFRFFVPPATGDNFSLAPGEVVFVQVTGGGPEVMTMAGDVTAVKHSLVPGGFNFISLPLQRADLTTAGEVAADITNIDAMLSWNEATQTFRFFVPPATGDDFSVSVGTPFVIDLDVGGPPEWP